jgi:hypothetical protein
MIVWHSMGLDQGPDHYNYHSFYALEKLVTMVESSTKNKSLATLSGLQVANAMLIGALRFLIHMRSRD